MPVEQGAVNPVFVQHELQFLAQGFVNLSGGPSQQLVPRHNARLTTQPTQSDFGNLVRRNRIANLAQDVQLKPCWVDRFLFHPCLVAGPKRQPNTFFSKSAGWLCSEIYEASGVR